MSDKAKELIKNFSDLYWEYTEQVDDEVFFEYCDKVEELMKDVCDIIGHLELIPDQCGIPGHDYCIRCHTRRDVIERQFIRKFIGKERVPHIIVDIGPIRKDSTMNIKEEEM